MISDDYNKNDYYKNDSTKIDTTETPESNADTEPESNTDSSIKTEDQLPNRYYNYVTGTLHYYKGRMFDIDRIQNKSSLLFFSMLSMSLLSLIIFVMFTKRIVGFFLKCAIIFFLIAICFLPLICSSRLASVLIDFLGLGVYSYSY